ncbi:2-(3-amino-3-carboxypropyl)histidine synthase subunit 2 [Frankliniella fusca]|uniref:2-(3-amino-3-carboxypropyl)histidine synthase subunit 2 n=1 Tax=Frankliniella fusca TaxID=407009 RepID=A0AAE1LKA6_9NEOP|nr:2-(3-amino-3-carboxypropyl)histidine synthase subunit 2 [Frankliniella fusca]
MAAFSSDEQRCIEQHISELSSVCPTSPDRIRGVYDLDRCDEWIKANGLSKFPDNLLCDSPDVLLSLQHSSGAQCFILGDTSYGSCCVDEVSAEHVQADGIIHFGHACLSPTKRLPVLYIFQRKPLNIQKLVDAVTVTFENCNTKLLVIYDVGYAHKIEGSNLDDYCVLYIGEDGRTFTNYLLEFTACKLFRYDPADSVSSVLPADGKISKFLMKRLHLVERVKDARTLGILIGTLGVDGYLDAVDRIKVLAKKTENSLLDWKEFYQPVVSLYEVELACNSAREWSPKYVTNFRQLLSGGVDHVELSDNLEESSMDVSLITGKVRNIDIPSSVDNLQDRSIAARGDLSVCVSSGSQFLSNRSWQGLEPNLGQTPVELASLGRSGVASSYQSEPMQKSPE